MSRDAPAPSRGSGEAGFLAGLGGLIFGTLVFVGGTLLVANAWGVVDTKMAVTAAARNATRTYVDAPDRAAALADGLRAAQETLSGLGRDPGRAQVSFAGSPWGRCAVVRATVTYPAPLAFLPFIGRVGSAEQVGARHSELLDPYRSGLRGVATC